METNLHINSIHVRVYCNGYTFAQKVALWSQVVSLSSLTGLGGIFRASRVAAEELKNWSHLIFAVGEAFAVTINCNFSIVNSWLVELNE